VLWEAVEQHSGPAQCAKHPLARGVDASLSTRRLERLDVPDLPLAVLDGRGVEHTNTWSRIDSLPDSSYVAMAQDRHHAEAVVVQPPKALPDHLGWLMRVTGTR
jgi:hypothetical protein